MLMRDDSFPLTAELRENVPTEISHPCDEAPLSPQTLHTPPPLPEETWLRQTRQLHSFPSSLFYSQNHNCIVAPAARCPEGTVI